MPVILRPNQLEAADAVEDAFRAGVRRPLVDSCVGSGKSLGMGELARRAIVRGERVILASHTRELVEQNAAACRALGLQTGINAEALGERTWRAPVISASIQSVYSSAHSFGPIGLLIVDECFPAGTSITTPDSSIPIETIRAGDTVCHALGNGTVQATSKRLVSELVEIEFDDGSTIRSTGNHQLFTLQGWTPAQLASGGAVFTIEGVRCLRDNFLSRQDPGRRIVEGEGHRGLGQTDVLFERLLQEKRLCESVQDASRRYPAGDVECGSVDAHQGVRELQRPVQASRTHVGREDASHISQSLEQDALLYDILLQEAGECYQRPGSDRTHDGDIETDRAPAEGARRKRARHDESASGVDRSTRAGVGGRTSGADATATRLGLSDELQDRHCESAVADSDRGGRRFARGEAAGARRQERRSPSVLGVVRVSRIELASPCYVYNVQVSGHPSYFANGLLAHNCDLIPHSEQGMYRALHRGLGEPRLSGWSGTVFRLSGGSLVEGEGAPFDKVVYRYTIIDGIRDEYLVPAFSAPADDKIDPARLKVAKGDYTGASQDVQMIAAMDNHIAQMIHHGRNRRSWLVFEASTKATLAMAERMNAWGIKTASVLSDTPAGERAAAIAAYRAGRIRALTNINTLSVGFDVQETDLIVMRRRTKSLRLYVQQIGRGLRTIGGTMATSVPAGKDSCLVLDFAGNIDQHGPLDFIRPKETVARLVSCESCGKRNAAAALKCWSCSEPMTKLCPACLASIQKGVLDCPECNHDMRTGGAGEPRKAAALLETPSGAALISSYKTGTERAGGWIPIRKTWERDGVASVATLEGTWALPAALSGLAAEARWVRVVGEEVVGILVPNGASRSSIRQYSADGTMLLVPMPSARDGQEAA